MARHLRPDRLETDQREQPVRHVRAPIESRPDLQEALAVVRLRKWSILAITALVVGVALLVSSQQTPIYQATAEVLVTSFASDPQTESGPAPELNLATEAELVSSDAVAEVVAEDLDIEGDPATLLGSLSVDSPTDTEIIQISYGHSDPAEARRRAQGFAVGYLEYRQRTATEQVNESAEAIARELEVLNARLDEIEQELAVIAEGDPRRGSLESEAALVQGLILDSQLQRLGLPKGISGGHVVQPAPLPDSPASPNHVLNAGFGLAAGLALGIGFAFLRDRLAGRLRSGQELEAHLGAPVLGSIPRVGAWKRRRQTFLVTRDLWRSPEAEAYRMLRTSVLSAASTKGAKSLLVTSPHSGEGKSATVANLGVVVARAGMTVTIVSADLRKPRVHEFFGVPASPGLVDVLQGRASLAAALKGLTMPMMPSGVSIRFLPSGAVPDNPAELLGSAAMGELLADLERASDLVLIDAPPILPVTDALVLAPRTGGVLVVIGSRSATVATVSSARQQLDKVGARVLGATLSGPDPDLTQTSYAY
jgi:polysaccharide biosynthesis transport protein